jgi:hypothetical protein
MTDPILDKREDVVVYHRCVRRRHAVICGNHSTAHVLSVGAFICARGWRRQEPGGQESL